MWYFLKSPLEPVRQTPVMLRQAQHEREKVNVFNIHSVHPELGEGYMRVCRTGSLIPLFQRGKRLVPLFGKEG
jgi:hypothetical protein